MQSLEVGLVPTPQREPRLTRWLRRGSGILAHLVALGFTIFLTVLSRPGTSLFSWHPVFMALAVSLGFFLQFCLCMAEAILLFSPEHSPFFFCSRKARIRLHWAGQTLVILFAALGLGFIISSRTRSELPHLVSWHSWVEQTSHEGRRNSNEHSTATPTLRFPAVATGCLRPLPRHGVEVRSCETRPLACSQVTVTITFSILLQWHLRAEELQDVADKIAHLGQNLWNFLGG
ncbi:probable transmembrane reductase CYB561D1 isoform X3 [Hippopotamus amphibius kiboko]|uniref:probable transmembrane reductase CYB561D1 isoform X3 n=1 Tax=Hippopotamus amphibius kiboko TaxID=575201 RepID=UPI002596C860|nr:probable transmembrane reductase CYB561D1 isoform X3 [Hippopotamus amphibius kiboko]